MLNHALPSPFPGTSSRQLTAPHPRERVISSCIAGPSVSRASPRLSGFKLVSTWCTLQFWLSVRHDVNHSRRTQPVVSLNRSSRPLVNLNRCTWPVVSVAAGPQTQVPCATLKTNRDHPPAMRQPILFKHSCIFLCAKCFIPMSAGFSTPRTFTVVSSRRATLLHPQDLGMETSHSHHHEAIAFDAVTSTRTRGFTTFAMSAAMATAPRALDALLVSA